MSNQSMSIADDGRRGSEPSPPCEGAGNGVRVERRSPTRPKFVGGWRKDVQQKVAEAKSALPLDLTPSNRIDVWMANPDALMKAESSLTLLSAQDWEAINRIQDPSSRRSVIATRVLLRIGLSRASGHMVAPGDWHFTTDGNLRPTVGPGLPAINFSISHLDPLVLVAVSTTLEVGIDIECVDQNVSEDVIGEFTHLDEHDSVGGLPRPQEIREFLRLWTLKEAYTKMVGTGHGLDFKTIKFTLDPANLNSIAGQAKPGGSLQFENFYVSSQHNLFHAALAIRHPTGDTGVTEVQIISLTSEDKSGNHYAAPLEG
jgi:phosphopantetheinyl transferase